MDGLMAYMIPIFGMATGIIITAIVFIFIYRVRIVEHKERLIALEKGIPIPQDEKASRPSHRPNRLFRGIFCLFVGLGLFIALYVSSGIAAAMWGVLVGFVGLGYLTYWFVAERGRVTPELYNREEKID